MKIERADGLAWRTIGSETFVVDLRSKLMHGLNGAGGAVWQAIVDGGSLEAVARRLATAAGAPGALTRATAAVTAFVRRLAELDLVRGEALGLPAELPEAAAGGCDFEAPEVLWSEEMVAFAQQQSCLFDNHLNCPAGPAT